MLTVESIRETQRLLEIASDWQALTEVLPNTTPFHSPAWMLAWWKHLGSGDLRCLACWNAEKLVALLPLFRHEWNGRRQLTLMGSGVTDYLEPSIAAPEAVHLFADQLRTEIDWDVCDWQDLPAGSLLKKMRGLPIEVEEEIPCSAIHLPEIFDGFWVQRSADLRRNIKRYAKKAEAEGSMSFRVVKDGSAELVEELIQLHGQRWRHRGEAGMVEVNASGSFLREVAQMDSCRLFSLEWKDRVVAATMGFVRGNSVYSYLSAFDPQYEILGFGRYLLYRSLQWALEHGYDTWDFLRGDEPYKASWGAVPIQKCRVRIIRS